jgi:signal transduction histidine kinase
LTTSSDLNIQSIADTGINELEFDGNTATFTTFKKPLLINNSLFTHYKRLEGRPITILAGYDKTIASNIIWENLTPKIITTFLSVIFFASILYIFRRCIILPTQQLAQIAEQLSRSIFDKVPLTPSQHSYEMCKIEGQLIRLKNYIDSEREIREKLESTKSRLTEALNPICDSDKEKESFLSDMQKALQTPIHAIMNGASLLKKMKKEQKNIKDLDMILDAIYDAGKQLNSLTTEFLNPVQVDIKEVIEKCVVIQKRYAAETNITLATDIELNIPFIWADRLRLRQIILSIIHHSLHGIQANTQMNIQVSLDPHNDHPLKWLKIVIESEDASRSSCYEELQTKDEHSVLHFNRDPNMMNLSIYDIHQLVYLHHGTFEIDDSVETSTRKFIILLPYLTKDEVETLPSLSSYNKHNDENSVRKSNKSKDSTDNSTNVIKFPLQKKE